MPTDIRKPLAEALLQNAEWRELKADGYPEDDRNRASARRLHDLAAHVLQLSPNDTRLRAIGASSLWSLDPLMLGDEASMVASRVGFDDPVVNLDSAVTRLARASINDIQSFDENVWLELMQGDDPGAALEALALFREWLDLNEEELVVKARVEGMSWADVAGRLHRSKQAVWEKHRADDSDVSQS